ncbi:MAG TPA: helix-turn-helix domain-containing protein [Thermoleophilaceae bacterium]|nr:helix-turn-helix domain-containing protein [Thermoleophilaceae bacterium]
MTRMPLDDMNCSIARTLDVIGDAWTPLILRDIAIGITRFDAIQRDLGISRKVLSERLGSLIEHGVLQRVPYQTKPVRYDYYATEKGADLGFVLLAMQTWGNRWIFDEQGPPLLLRHEPCGATIEAVTACSNCGEQLSVGDLTPLPGPSFDPDSPEVSAALERREAAFSAARGSS